MAQKKHSDTPGGGRKRTLRGTMAALVASTPLWACTPTLDWRSVALPDTQLVAELPCRPSRFQREVVVAGTSLNLFMLSCEAGGVTYGVATAEVGNPTRVDAVLQGLRDSAAAAIRASAARTDAASLAGATPFAASARAFLRGQRPDGEAVEESVRVFARGTRVFQASAVGATLPEGALQPFEEGLHFDLEKRAPDPN